MQKIYFTFILIFSTLALFSKGWECDLDALHSFRLNLTDTFNCPNETACVSPQNFNWSVDLGGIPDGICEERCALLFYVNFGAHNASSMPGTVFKASDYTTKRDLYRFFDLLNNFYPYILGYDIGWIYGGFGNYGGIEIANLTTQTISDIEMTINKISVKNSTTSGYYEVNFDLSFSILGYAHPNLTNTTELTAGDSFVRNDTNRDNNYGDLVYLEIHDEFGLPNETSVAYLAFELSNYTSLNKATLRLYGSVDSNIEALVYSVNGTFNESDITWQNAPPIWLAASLFHTFIYSNETWYEFDITPMVREEFPAGGGTMYLAVIGQSASTLARFSSREGDAVPQLVLYCVVPVDNSSTSPITSPVVSAPTSSPTSGPTSSPSGPSAPSTTNSPSSSPGGSNIPVDPTNNVESGSNQIVSVFTFSRRLTVAGVTLFALIV